jgi:uncharacterized protein (UPF0332 family)
MDKKITVNTFSKYRLDRAKQEYEVANLLYRENKLLAANNRAYYSIFYAIKAVLALEKKDFKRHKDVIAYFNKEYIHTEIFPKKIGRKIAQAKAIREDSDYDEEYEPSSEITALQIETARELIELVEKYLDNKTRQAN